MPAKSNYQGVILAAGHGSRMGPFGNLFPKPIIPIANKPLLVYQLEHMKRLGIDEIIIVIGHLGHRITQVLGDGTQFGVRIKYVEQEKRLGIAHAVGQLETCIDRPFMLFLGDIFFDLTDLDAMVREMEQHGAAAVLAVREETEPDAVKRNFCVITRDDGSVRRVIEKPRQLPCMTKGCGLYLFDLAIFDAIRHTPRTAMRDEYEITDSIQILIDYEYPVRVAPVVDFDINVTYIGDLITCSRHVLQRSNINNLIGDHCNIAQGTELVETVIGNHVTIAKPAKFARCVVLSNVHLEDGQDYQDAVFTQEGILRLYHQLK